MGVEENKAVVCRLYQLMNARRFDEVWELFRSDATWGGARSRRYEGHSLERMRQLLVDPIPVFVTGGMEFRVVGMVAEGDVVAAEVEGHGELVNGTSYDNQYHMLFEFEGGRIRWVKEYNDTAHAQGVFFDSGLVDPATLSPAPQESAGG